MFFILHQIYSVQSSAICKYPMWHEVEFHFGRVRVYERTDDINKSAMLSNAFNEWINKLVYDMICKFLVCPIRILRGRLFNVLGSIAQSHIDENLLCAQISIE